MSRSHNLNARFPVPSHAYVPGQTARHPENWFDAIKASVTQDVPVAELDQTEAWQAGLEYLAEGYFWECHEVLEAVWLQAPEGSPERAMTQGIIQLANARLKVRMRRPRAALRLCDMVKGHLARCPADRQTLGLTVQDVLQWTQDTRDHLQRGNILQ